MPTVTITAAPPTVTATSRSRFRPAALVIGVGALVLGLTGCGGSGSPFGWLHAQAPPTGWKVARIPTGAAFAYPPAWRLQRGDSGTVTAALLTADGRFVGYLNLTPRQGSESLSNWSSFRPKHNGDEGDQGVKELAAAHGLHFLSGHGSCVKDSYTTRSGDPFVEIACLVAGARGETVIVAAAPPNAWSRQSGTLERAIEGLRT